MLKGFTRDIGKVLDKYEMFSLACNPHRVEFYIRLAFTSNANGVN